MIFASGQFDAPVIPLNSTNTFGTLRLANIQNRCNVFNLRMYFDAQDIMGQTRVACVRFH
jgi:hypothetical protein